MDMKPNETAEIKELIRVKIDIYGLTEADSEDLREHARRRMEKRNE